jgi:hypothetical protein
MPIIFIKGMELVSNPYTFNLVFLKLKLAHYLLFIDN